jgi:glutamate-1-semialdehyde aminotransferase
MSGLQGVLDEVGVVGKVVGHPSMFSIFIGDGEPTEYRDLARHDDRLYDTTIMSMIGRGVMPCPDALEPWFTCGAHTDDDVTRTLEVFEASLKAVLRKPLSMSSVVDE